MAKDEIQQYVVSSCRRIQDAVHNVRRQRQSLQEEKHDLGALFSQISQGIFPYAITGAVLYSDIRTPIEQDSHGLKASAIDRKQQRRFTVPRLLWTMRDKESQPYPIAAPLIDVGTCIQQALQRVHVPVTSRVHKLGWIVGDSMELQHTGSKA
jgi:hypothetical protein